jgi:hypothetical protein
MNLKAILPALALIALTACSGNDDTSAAKETVTVTHTQHSPQLPASSEAPVTPSPRAYVKAYSDAFLTGQGVQAYDYLTDRCKNAIGLQQFLDLTTQAQAQYGLLPWLDYSERVNGDEALVTYTYTKSELNQTAQKWVWDGSKWRYNAC